MVEKTLVDFICDWNRGLYNDVPILAFKVSYYGNGSRDQSVGRILPSCAGYQWLDANAFRGSSFLSSDTLAAKPYSMNLETMHARITKTFPNLRELQYGEANSKDFVLALSW